MRRIRKFIRDIELHGHHPVCPVSSSDEDSMPFCMCAELDHDDWIAAGEAAMDQQREEPRKVDDDD